MLDSQASYIEDVAVSTPATFRSLMIEIITNPQGWRSSFDLLSLQKYAVPGLLSSSFFHNTLYSMNNEIKIEFQFIFLDL